jgi:CoA:oxalate CoA-transferase
MSHKPLEGHRVFDFTGAKSGPFCTMILADFGAEVIDIENPKKLDGTRIMKPMFNNTSTEFFSLHRGKKNVLIDMKSPAGKKLAYELIKKCDIFVENGKPGSAAKLGLGYEDVKKLRPDVIYTSISGFGQTGPYRDRAAFDTVVQAMSGFMSLTGPEGGEYIKSGPSIADICTGIMGALGTAMAVIQRDHTHEGTYLDLAMMDTMCTLCDVAIDDYLNTGNVRKPLGNKHPANCIAEPVKCKDATFILQMFGEPMHKRFCQAFNMPDFTLDPRFSSGPQRVAHRDELVHNVVEPVLAKYTMKEVAEILEKNHLPFGTINTIDKVVADPQFKARDCIVNVTDSLNGTHPTIGMPFKFNNFDMPKDTFADQPGEHIADVLGNVLGMSREEIKKTYDEMGVEINL